MDQGDRCSTVAGIAALYTDVCRSDSVFLFFLHGGGPQPVDMADNMKKYGGFIPGIRPGQRTSDYIYKVDAIPFAGALYWPSSV